ncbi:MAG: hypothetical protein WB765_00390 [Acidimicrobiales bacterium]|jgi:hypothetical protein
MSVTATVDMSRARAKKRVVTDRLAGVGGLVFAAALISQNLLRANAPGFGAAPAKVTEYFLHHRAAALIPLGLYPVEMIALFMFVAAIRTKPEQEESRWWATVGVLGSAAIASLFAIVNITEIVLTAKAEQLAPSPSVVQALWGMHAAAFGLDMAAIGAALIGLSRAAASVDLIPAWLKFAALPGAACLLIAAVFTVAIANGGPWIALGLIGFVVWLVFVVMTSVSLLRRLQIS